MRVAVALLLSATLALAGCLQQSAVTPNEAVIPEAPAGALDGILASDANGTLVPVPDEFGVGPRVVQKLLGTRGAEPNVGVTSTGAIFVSSGDYVMRSRDNGNTWEQVYNFGSVADATDYGRNSDPMLWVDPVTDRIFAPFMFPTLACSNQAWSDDDGETWLDKPLTCGLPGVDHQKLATGPYSAAVPVPAGAVYPNAVYYCYNKIVSTNCAVSFDGGMSFPVDRVVATAAECGGINGHPAAAPDGTMYVPLGLGCGTPAIAYTKDNGLTWTVRMPDVGGLGQADIDPDVTVTADGMAYYFFRATKDNRMYFIRSNDGFETIAGPFPVSPPGVTSTRFPVITSGDPGRVAFGYLGTRDTAETPQDAPDETRWHAFVTFSLDADGDGPTFTTVQVTPDEDPVQIGYMWEGGGGDPGRNLLDFNDLHVGPEGRVVMAFTDGCVKSEEFDCAGNPGAKPDDSRARATAIAILEEGPSLYAAVGYLRSAPAPAAEPAPEGSATRAVRLLG